MPARSNRQTSIYETTIDNPALAELLDEREEAAAAKKTAKKTYDELDKKAKAIIETLDLGDAPVRVGNFVITRKMFEGGHVAFEKNASTRTYISLLGED